MLADAKECQGEGLLWGVEDERTVGYDRLRARKGAASGIPTYPDGGESLRTPRDAKGNEDHPEVAGGDT